MSTRTARSPIVEDPIIRHLAVNRPRYHHSHQRPPERDTTPRWQANGRGTITPVPQGSDRRCSGRGVENGSAAPSQEHERPRKAARQRRKTIMDPRHIEQEPADAHELLNQASMARQAYNGLDGLPRVLRHTAGHSPTGVHPTPGTPRKPAVQANCTARNPATPAAHSAATAHRSRMSVCSEERREQIRLRKGGCCRCRWQRLACGPYAGRWGPAIVTAHSAGEVALSANPQASAMSAIAVTVVSRALRIRRRPPRRARRLPGDQVERRMSLRQSCLTSAIPP